LQCPHLGFLDFRINLIPPQIYDHSWKFWKKSKKNKEGRGRRRVTFFSSKENEEERLRIFKPPFQEHNQAAADRLKKDHRGNVEILERFCPPEYGYGEVDTVHPILICADLVAIGE
jgi:hypothetical protein